MCGIAGVLQKKKNLRDEQVSRIVSKMIDVVKYRGPDDRGTTVQGRVCLGHCRLSIIDLNVRSKQPMSAGDGDVWITFNGEIYNFIELRDELKRKGYVFRTESDTEVILCGWQEWGENVISRLRGMFAFALWDAKQQLLVLARDRFGKKPLFYSDRHDAFLFASETKSILQWPGFDRRPCWDTIHSYMSFRYCLGENSAFDGIKKVPPAHYLIVSPGKPIKLKRYWKLASSTCPSKKVAIADITTELIERLDDAIKCRLISDVPLGAFLSGGVDSSAVVARMSAMSTQPVKTFSVGFPIEGFDETEFALKVADRYDTDHRSFQMDFDIVGELPRLVWHYGEPYADASALVTYALAREIRKHVTVALTGDGGDEIFLGYSRYNRFRNLVKQYRDGVVGQLPYQSLLAEDRFSRVRDHYITSISTFREEHKIAGYDVNLADKLFAHAADQLGLALEDATEENAIDTVARLEVETYLPDDLLVKADIATMAVSLEGRSPFLDHEFADWAARLPASCRVFEREGALEMKALLKLALEPHLPQEILYRPKQGFAVPVNHWMRNDIRDFTIETLTSLKFRQRGLVTPAFVDWMLQRHFAQIEDHGTRIWTLLCLELWFQTFIDAAGDAPLDLNIVARPRTIELVH